MALRDLAGGSAADCGPVNPLAGLAKHLDGDRSLQHDAAARGVPGGVQERLAGAARDDRFADDFFRGGQAAGPRDAFRFDDVRSQLDGIRLARGPHDAWADEFAQRPLPPGAALHDAEFEQYFRAAAAEQRAGPAPGAAWQEEFFKYPQNMRPLDPREFAELEQYYHHAPAPAKISEITEEQWAAEYAEQGQRDKGKQKAPVEDAAFEKEWNAALDRAEDEFQATTDDVMSQLEREWGDLQDADAEFLSSSDYIFGEKRVPDAEYEFEPDNAFLTHPRPYDEGVRLMATGNLSDAALAFEAAARQDEHDGAAWLQLGLTQAENEKEVAAIRALQRAVREDPGNMSASMALAVSFTNEGAESQAFDSLERWIRTRYPDLPPSEKVNRIDRHGQVVRLFLSAVQRSKELDPDLQVGLGVLFNISCEYDKAVDCFQAALQARPEDYLLWNRLGATLANSGRSEEAIDAYYQALNRKPSFVRARFNLGVSCINIGCLKEAAEHFLGALALHGSGTQRNVSDNLWETLRRTFVMMNRRELIDQALKRDLQAFRGEFDF